MATQASCHGVSHLGAEELQILAPEEAYYADPVATWGYDPHTDTYVFGYRVQMLCAVCSGYDLPLSLFVYPANTSDVVVGIEVLGVFWTEENHREDRLRVRTVVGRDGRRSSIHLFALPTWSGACSGCSKRGGSVPSNATGSRPFETTESLPPR